MNNNNGFGSPVRTYKKPKRQDPLRTAAVLIMTAVIIAFVVVLIMSLTGTGMFADKKGGGDPKVDPPSSSTDESGSGSGEGSSDAGGSSEDPNTVKYISIDKTADDLHYGLLQLINEEHLYKFKEESLLDSMYENRPALKSYQLSKSTHMLKHAALVALNEMMDDFYTATEYKYMNVNKAYYDFDSQKDLFDRGLTTTPAGASDWHSGATFRFNGYNSETKKTVNISTAAEPKWVKEHAYEYGFIFRAPTHKKSIVGYEEAWQLRYVGIPHAEYMSKNDLCLEEYLAKLASDHKYGTTHLIVECVDGNTYEIYYVSAPSEGTLKLPVPENRPYTVSGDNMSGFIVTVTVEEGEPVVTPPSSSDAA